MTIVDIRDLTKSYMMGEVLVEALRGITFGIEAGEYIAITGPSGSGKSTLLNLLGCLDTPTRGTYLLEGRDVSHLDDNALSDTRRDRIGFIFQSYNLIPRLSVLENIELPLFYAGLSFAECRRRAERLAATVGLGRRAGHRPSELSGGEQQRVAIARALSNDPAIILADEPTGNLDTHTGKEILELLHEVWRQGATLIIVSHDVGLARNAPRVLHLINGLLVSDTVSPVGAAREALD